MRERCERCDVKQSTVVTARWQLCPSWECESCVAIPDPVREQTRELAEARTALTSATERAERAEADLTAARALLREALWPLGANTMSVTAMFDLRARIEAHLEGR